MNLTESYLKFPKIPFFYIIKTNPNLSSFRYFIPNVEFSFILINLIFFSHKSSLMLNLCFNNNIYLYFIIHLYNLIHRFIYAKEFESNPSFIGKSTRNILKPLIQKKNLPIFHQ
jgi:hypothetical protein